MTPPTNPTLAATHPDPYPYYERLLRERPLYRDDGLRCWVASSASAVSAILSSRALRVRPLSEPVPRGLVGSPAGDIFRRLVRMNDGENHRRLKQAVSTTLESIDTFELSRVSAGWAESLAMELGAARDLDRLTEFALRLPVYVLASLLGVAPERLPDAARWISDFASCLSPAACLTAIEQGKEAAARLLDLIGRSRGELAVRFETELRRAECPDGQTAVANALGFLFQAYESTAGLIGNTIVALGRGRAQASGSPPLRQVVREVARLDPPIQNTRRFVAAPCVIEGHELAKGDAVLVLLAAANLDPLAEPTHPSFTFGAGEHACPGERLAVTIAEAGVECLLTHGLDSVVAARSVSYRPSPNARVPIFRRLR